MDSLGDGPIAGRAPLPTTDWLAGMCGWEESFQLFCVIVGPGVAVIGLFVLD